MSADDTTTLNRDIAPGEVFRHSGSGLVINGNIGAGARIEADGGGLRVTGNVADGVTIKTRAPFQTDQGNFPFGALIDGTVGDRVTIDSNVAISLKHGAGDHLRIRCGASVGLSDAGDWANITSGGQITGGNIGRYSNIRCAKSCAIAELGHGSMIECGGTVQLTTAGHDCHVICSGNANMAALGENSTVESDSTAMVGIKHSFARVQGRLGRRIRQEGGTESDFALISDAKRKGPTGRQP